MGMTITKHYSELEEEFFIIPPLEKRFENLDGVIKVYYGFDYKHPDKSSEGVSIDYNEKVQKGSKEEPWRSFSFEAENQDYENIQTKQHLPLFTKISISKDVIDLLRSELPDYIVRLLPKS